MIFKMMLCWVPIIVLLGSTQNVNTFQVSNSTDIIQSLTSVVALLDNVYTTNTNINMPTTSKSKTIFTSFSLRNVTTHSSRENVQNLRSKSVTMSAKPTTGKVIFTSSKYPNNIFRVHSDFVDSSTLVKNASSAASVIVLVPIKSSVGNIATTQSNIAHNNVNKSTFVVFHSQKETINPVTKGLTIVHAVNTKSLTYIHSAGSGTLMLTEDSNKNTAINPFTSTPLPVMTDITEKNSPKHINKTKVNGNGSVSLPLLHTAKLSTSSPIPLGSSMFVTVGKKMQTSIKMENNSKSIMYATGSVMQPTPSSKVFMSSVKVQNSRKSVSPIHSEISMSSTSAVSVKINASKPSNSSKVPVISSKHIQSVSTKNTSININATQASRMSKVVVLPSSSKNITSVPTAKNTSIGGTHASHKSKIVILSKSKHINSSRSTVTTSIVIQTKGYSPLHTNPLIASTSTRSSLEKRSKHIITSTLSPSSVEERLQTKVVLPGFASASGKVPLTLAGRIGIGVAIAAGIIIIVLLIYFAKSKHKINRYRRYDNTYQIPGFTDIGGMVQLSTIGDSEYEILDATDYTRGDNPLYDIAQNPGQQQAPYENHGYARNEEGSKETGNTNNTNFTNFSTFKE